MDIKCPKCGSTEIDVGLDARDVTEAKCAVCGTYIKKLNTKEVFEFFTEKKDFALETSTTVKVVDLSETKVICPWCTEDYFTRRGRMGLINIPVENKYCPVCGRKRKPTDRDY